MCIFRANNVYFQRLQFVNFQHVNNSGRTYNADRGPVDLSMFEQDFPPSSDENGKRTRPSNQCGFCNYLLD